MADHSLAGRSVLVTGAGGFIGSHLAEQLVDADARVTALTSYNSRNDWGHLDDLAERRRREIEVVPGNLRDPFLVDRVVAGKEVVFHLGALIPIPYSYVAPSEFVETNVSGTLNVLEAARRHEVSRVVHTSTSETYGTALYTPMDENHPLQGQSPYSATKIAADKLAESFWRSFETPVVTVRPFNTFGPRQSARAFLPAVVSQALTSDVVRVGSLDPVRDMNFVGNTVDGFMLAGAVPGVEGEVFNVGSGVGVSMRQLLDTALGVLDRAPHIETDPQRLRPERSEVLELVCDAAAAKRKLGWAPAVSLEEGVERTVRWIADNLGAYKARIYNV